jgi:DNA (cytosine-5)-methyltransferase 1
VRVGALCAGYGGIEMGLAEVEDVELVWYAEFDDAPSRVMAHHHPGVPNLRDVNAIDWSALEPVDVLTGGYPCQPFSHAGKRLGEDDPRHLWPAIARGIGILRPALCLFENVRGHLSLGLDQVLTDLDRLGYDVRYYLLRAADVGAPHGRARLFIFAEHRDQGGPVDLPSGTPVAVTYGGSWWEPEQPLFGEAPFVGKLPPCGRLVDGHLYAEPRWSTRAAATLLPTPRASDWMGGGNSEHQRTLSGTVRESLLPTPRTSDTNGAGAHGTGGPDLRTVVGSLLPTPAVNDMGEGKTVEAWDAWTDRMKAEHGNGNGHGKSLAIEAQRLLPTPRTSDTNGAGAHGTGGPDLRTVVGSMIADEAIRWGDYAPAIVRWATVIRRPTPAPTEPGAKGGHRLSPRFVEWMQGLPEGWVCDVPDITRNHLLKMLGNGVVPQQAAAAYRAYLADTAKEKAA